MCPKCGKSFYNHYLCTLHYRSKHLHKTKCEYKYCHKCVTSQSNLDKHIETVHVAKKFKCKYSTAAYPTEEEIQEHVKTHRRYRKAEASTECQYCHNRYVDLKWHLATCSLNPRNKVKGKKFVCPYCDAQYAQLKYFNYHEKKTCKKRPQ